MVVFAFGFANYLMLWGTAAAALPILIHLLNRRKFKEMRWAATRFLLAAIRKNQRRIRLEQLILLAVRTLIVLLAALAMAKPFLEAMGVLPLIAGTRTHLVLALDGSLSMGYTPAERARFEEAKRLAGQMVKDSRRGDVISVVLLGSPPKVVIGDPSANHEEVRREIDEIKLPHGRTDLTASFDAIVRVLGASEIPQKQVVVLSDLQAASWRSENPNALKAALTKLDQKQARCVVIDLGNDHGENRAVTGLEINVPVVTTGAPFVVRATLKNFGPNPVADNRARLLVDGQYLDERSIESWPVGEEVAVAFTQTLLVPGDHLIEVRIDDDPLVLDNKRSLVVPVREKVDMLLVDGDPKPERFGSEADYLSEALDPDTEGEPSVSLIRVETVNAAQLLGRDLSSHDVVALCNVAPLTEGEANALETYLKQGGGLVIFGGDQILAENANRVLFRDGKGLLPARIEGTVGDAARRESGVGFDLLGLKHPIVAPFAGTSEAVQAGLTSVKTWQYHTMVLPENSNARVVLAFEGGAPAIVEAPRGRGRVVQVATTADADWTTWPLHPSYPPVMEQVVLYAASGRFQARNVAVGQPLQQAFPPTGVGAEAAVRRPDDEPAMVRLAGEGDVSLFSYDATDLSGAYRVDVGAPISISTTFAVNPDPTESDPAKLDEAGLREAVPGWNFAYATNSRKVADDPTSVGQRGELHRTLLWSMLALLLVETILAWRFSHHA